MRLSAAPCFRDDKPQRVGVDRIERYLAKAQDAEVVVVDRLPLAANLASMRNALASIFGISARSVVASNLRIRLPR